MLLLLFVHSSAAGRLQCLLLIRQFCKPFFHASAASNMIVSDQTLLDPYLHVFITTVDDTLKQVTDMFTEKFRNLECMYDCCCY